MGSWNMENASASMDEAIKSAWRVTSTLIEFNIHCLACIKGFSFFLSFFLEFHALFSRDLTPSFFSLPCLTEADPTGKRSRIGSGQGDQEKLAKFFGVKPPLPKKAGPLDHLIEDDSFSRDIFYTMEGQIKGGTLEKLVERLTHHSISGFFFLFCLGSLLFPRAHTSRNQW